MNSKNASTTSEEKPINILISFLTHDKDNFDEIKYDDTFRLSHQLPGRTGAFYVKRNQLWRPAVAMARYGELEDSRSLVFDKYYLFYNAQLKNSSWFHEVIEDIREACKASPRETDLIIEEQGFSDPYNFEQVYTFLYNKSLHPDFHGKGCRCYVNCTSGTYVMRSCLFVLTQEGCFPGVRIEPRPWIDLENRSEFSAVGSYSIDDPKSISSVRRSIEGQSDSNDQEILTSGLKTLDPRFKELLGRIIRTVGARFKGKPMMDPILFTGATGSGKTTIAENIASKIWEIPDDKFIRVNCAELRGDPSLAKIALFGCKKGSHSNAKEDRAGKFQEADGGVLFLDEIGELHEEVQAMLLTAIERRPGKHGFVCTPLGGLHEDEVEVRFHLICGTNRNLEADPRFRKDLLARISTWQFELPSLAQRRVDIPEQKKYALVRFEEDYGLRREFSNDARVAFEEFADKWPWKKNFRELNDMIRRMATLTPEGRLISADTVQEEINWMRQRAEREEAVQSSDKPQQPAPVTPSVQKSGMELLREILGETAFNGLAMRKRVLAAYLVEQCARQAPVQSQKDLARKAGVSESDVSRWLAGCKLQFKGGSIIPGTGS